MSKSSFELTRRGRRRGSNSNNQRNGEDDNEPTDDRQLIVKEDVLGYKVTLHPEPKKSTEYFVKFTPIAPLTTPQLHSQAPSFATQISQPGPSAVVPTNQVDNDQDRSSSASIGAHLLEAVFHILAEAEQGSYAGRRVGRRRLRRNVSRRRRPTERRPRRNRGRRQFRNAEDDSETSMYEVVEVDYEKISDLNSSQILDWRIVPRYDLSPSEAAKQEKELFFLMTTEERYEAAEKAKDGESPCCICRENCATRVIIPCGHKCVCRPCAFYVATNRSTLAGSKLPKRCPICQAVIGLMARIM